jgi:hypothetical protein
VITYEESDVPRLAVAELGLTIGDAMQWVRDNPDPLMLRGSDGYYILVHIGASGAPVIEQPGLIQNVTDTQLAASKFRDLLRAQGSGQG